MPKKQVSASVEEMSRVKSFIDSKYISEAKQEEILSKLNVVDSQPTLRAKLEMFLSLLNIFIDKHFTLVYVSRPILYQILGLWFDTLQGQAYENVLGFSMFKLARDISRAVEKVRIIYLHR